MHGSRILSRIAVGLIAIAVAEAASAETITMTCKNSRFSYRVSFDSEKQRFLWSSDAGQADYYVVKFKTGEDGLTVWGKARRYGNDFIAYFAPEGWMKNFYANGSSMTDVCQGPQGH